MICCDENDDSYHKGREGGGQRVMIEIIISENDDNDGQPLTGFTLHHLKRTVSYPSESRVLIFGTFPLSPPPTAPS